MMTIMNLSSIITPLHNHVHPYTYKKRKDENFLYYQVPAAFADGFLNNS